MRSFLFPIPFLLLFSIHSLAQPGTLDQSFGNGGKVVTDFFGGNDRSFSTILQPDGKILVAGYAYNGSNNDFAIVRYKTDGVIDSSFGVNGKVLNDFGNSNDVIGSIVLQPDGKILAGGQVDFNFAVARYKIDGSLDSSFGLNGRTIITGYSIARVITCLQEDGKIILVSFGFGAVGESFILLRFTANGLLDNTFDHDGIVSTQFTDNSNAAYAAVIQKDGKILVAGVTGKYGSILAIARYNENGSLDSTFGANGKVTSEEVVLPPYGVAIALTKDEKIVISGIMFDQLQLINKFYLIKFKTNGNVDSSFGNNGNVITTIRGEDDRCLAISIQDDEKIIQIGSSSENSIYDFAIVRYNSDGSIDNEFGDSGRVVTPFEDINSMGFSIVIQQDDKIVVAGSTVDGVNNNFAIARYNIADVLPITLSSFTAVKKQNSVLLNWQTASESNNSYFAIERSNNNSNFKELAKVNSKGNSTQVQQYSFEDYLPLTGTNYYRLRQVNKDGTATISKTVLVDFSKAAIIKIYPNPVKNVITIEGLTGKKTTISIIDLNGRVLTTTSTNDASYTWNIKALPQGTYYLRTEADKKVNTMKFVKE